MRQPTAPLDSGHFDVPSRGHYVYRHVDAAGNVIYVGLSSNLLARTGQHAQSSPWWRSVIRVEWDLHDTRIDAERAESEAINRLAPAHNIIGFWHLEPEKPPLAGPEPERALEDAHTAARTAALRDRY